MNSLSIKLNTNLNFEVHLLLIMHENSDSEYPRKNENDSLKLFQDHPWKMLEFSRTARISSLEQYNRFDTHNPSK